jgi:hypothetical protein
VGLKNTNRRLVLQSLAARNREPRSLSSGSSSSGIMFRDPFHGVGRHPPPAVAACVAAAAWRCQGRGVAGAAAGERGPAPARPARALRTSRPPVVRRALAADTAPPLGSGLPDDPRDAAGLAPQTRSEEVGLQSAAQPRTTAHSRRGQSPGPAHVCREPGMGSPAYPRRTHPPRPPDSGLHRVEHPEPSRHRPRSTSHRTDLEAVPHRSGRAHHRR